MMSKEAKDATHLLKCNHHSYGVDNRYYMKCYKVNETESGKVRIVVFGDRNIKNTEYIKRIRYVDPDRLIKIEDKN